VNDGPMVTLDHTEVVRAVQHAMAVQLQRDGRLEKDMELGMVFYSDVPEQMYVLGSVQRCGRTLFELKGDRPQLCAVATQLALTKLTPAERSGLAAAADVHWRTVQFTSDGQSFDRFLVDVAFRRRGQPQ